MRMILPTQRERRGIQKNLSSFFHEHREMDFKRAIAAICRFYRLPRPKVDWYEYLDWGRTVGHTYENGKIHLIHPENWKKGRKYNSERQWINAVYHEMGHYIFWSDAERKANTFAARMERRLTATNGANGHGTTRVALRNGTTRVALRNGTARVALRG